MKHSGEKNQATTEKWRKDAVEYLAKLPKYKDLKDSEGKPCIDNFEEYLRGAKLWKNETDNLKPTK
jgi:hypothetical protein